MSIRAGGDMLEN